MEHCGVPMVGILARQGSQKATSGWRVSQPGQRGGKSKSRAAVKKCIDPAKLVGVESAIAARPRGRDSVRNAFDWLYAGV
jgi:hypothetical protein